MKKMLMMLAILLGSYASAQDIPAMEFSIQGGSFLNSEIVGDRAAEGKGDQAFIGYFEGSFNVLKSERWKFGPVAKLFFYDDALTEAINGPDNNYGISAGLEIGLSLGGGSRLDIGYELPIPGQRENIFESVLSPSLIVGVGKGLGLKINYDYFFQKKIFEYQGAITAGLVYQF